MAAEERLKVIFNSVFVRDDSDPGAGDFTFDARVRALPVGNPSTIFPAHEGRSIFLPQPTWSGIVDVAGLNEVDVVFHVIERDKLSADDDLGALRHKLRRPFQQRNFRTSNAFWLLEWEVQLKVDGKFGRHPPDTVFACRQNVGSVTCTTVSGTSFLARMEFHPVRPVPAPPPATALPARPAYPAGTAQDNNIGGTAVAATDPINIVPNPAVIPILGPPAAAPPGPHTNDVLDQANWANDRNCARIEYTHYVPASLAFTDNDPRLEWTVVSVAGGGNASFLGPARGRKVRVFGTAAGEVRFEVRFKGALFATYRALVDNLRRIPCRCNIINGTTADSTPRVTPADIKNHVDIANRFLRQLALELTLDTNATVTNGAVATAIPGIFRIGVARGRTRNLDVAGQERASILNHRPGVMNFAYIHSTNVAVVGGAAQDFPHSTAPAPAAGARPQVTDSGTPSTSWIRPTGVGVGADATVGTVTMQLIAGIPRAGHPLLFSMVLTDINGGALLPPGNHATPAQQLLYAKNMCHEFCHILNLGHRVEGVPAAGATPARDMTAADAPAALNNAGIFWDGLLHPPNENVMHWRGLGNIAQDFDIIQARAVAFSPLVTGATPVAPAVVPPPPPPPPVIVADAEEYVIQSGDWLSKIAPRHGMTWQELYNYDGGTGIPNRDRLSSGDPDLIYPGEVILVPKNA